MLQFLVSITIKVALYGKKKVVANGTGVFPSFSWKTVQSHVTSVLLMQKPVFSSSKTIDFP